MGWPRGAQNATCGKILPECQELVVQCMCLSESSERMARQCSAGSCSLALAMLCRAAGVTHVRVIAEARIACHLNTSSCVRSCSGGHASIEPASVVPKDDRRRSLPPVTWRRPPRFTHLCTGRGQCGLTARRGGKRRGRRRRRDKIYCQRP